MMVDVAKIWIPDHATVLDPTYGLGNFWTIHRPKNLIGTDLDPTKTDPVIGPVDFTQMPWTDGSFNVVVFDPTYVTPGGRETSGIKEMHNAYGMDSAKKTVKDQWNEILRGLRECIRVSNDLVMVKCMNYISSGAYQDVEYDVNHYMRAYGLKMVDQFRLVKKHAGPQPLERTRKCSKCKGVGGPQCNPCLGTGRIVTTQQHARNNSSVLFVGQKCRN